MAGPASLTHLDGGRYEASRAAALSGVPERTIYHWATAGLVVPSVSQVREKLWSYGDLLTLRLVDWLRRPKSADGDGGHVARTSMAAIRDTLAQLEGDLWRPDASGHVVPTILVGSDGRVFVDSPSTAVPASLDGVDPFPEMLDLLAPFHAAEGGRGPDLRRPRSRLRIVPGKVSGEPHLQDSRLMTATVAALARHGYALREILELYPREDPEGIAQAIELEADLARSA